MLARSRHVRIVIVAVLLAAAGPSAHAVTIRVDCAGGGDYLTIQDGVAAATAGDTVLVWPGLYPEYVEMASSADGVILRSLAGPGVTTIDGSSLDSRITVSCKQLSAGARIEGFRVTGTSTAISLCVMNVYQSMLEVHSCVITEGSGLRGIAVQSSDVSIVGCTISGVGDPDSPGGGVDADQSYVRISNSSICENTAREGAAIYGFQCTGLELVGNTIASNTATQGGAAIDLWNPGPVYASENTFVGNAAAPSGAATMYVYGSADELVFTDNVFFGNSTQGERGSIVLVQGTPTPVFNGNFLHDVDVRYQVAFGATPLPHATFDFTGNWWGTTDPSEIADRIFDNNDSDYIRWTADFSDWCTDASCSGTATSVPEASRTETSWGRLKSLYR